MVLHSDDVLERVAVGPEHGDDLVKAALESMLSQQPTQVTVSIFGNDSNIITSKDELMLIIKNGSFLQAV